MKYLSFLLILSSCGYMKVEKPFIIVSKNLENEGFIIYTYEDANGRHGRFQDTIVYEIGDTIK